MSQLCNKQFGSLCVFLDLFVYFFVKGIKKKKKQHSNIFLAFMKYCPMFPGRKAKKKTFKRSPDVISAMQK